MAAASSSMHCCCLALVSAQVWACVLLLSTTVRSLSVIREFLPSDSFWCLGECQKGETNFTLLPNANSTDPLAGRLMYKTPVQLFNTTAATFASFSTSFVFTINAANSGSEIGDGLAFVITPSYPVPRYSGGGAMGLFNPNHSTGDPADGSTGLVAIEFDTFAAYNHPWDPSYAPHVGLDLNSLKSANVVPYDKLRAGTSIRAWIDYSSVTMQLQVRMSAARYPLQPSNDRWELVMDVSDFNLSSFVQENSYIGFSAGSGYYSQINTISDWTFTTSYEGEGGHALASPPLTSRSGAPSDWMITAGLVGCLTLISLGGLWCHRNQSQLQSWRKRTSSGAGSALPLTHSLHLPEAGYGPRRITYDLLHRATREFSTILGEGGFGAVYKGSMEDGTYIAVKKLKQSTKDGEKKFLAEVTSIGQLSHKNLVPLKGWCREHDELLLVYEYMPNGSLDDHLYPKRKKNKSNNNLISFGFDNAQEQQQSLLDWKMRFSIIQGVADALCYLHRGWQQPVIHRDIKPSNVMLDAYFTARVGDFGLAVAMNSDKFSQSVSHGAGTFGYFAPEIHQKMGTYSDVFSFGVLVLEVVCGRKPFDFHRPPEEYYIRNWIWSLYCNSDFQEDALQFIDAVDPSVRADCNVEEAVMLLKLGLMCSFPDASSRPSMSLVTQFLAGYLELPPIPRELPTVIRPHKDITSSSSMASF